MSGHWNGEPVQSPVEGCSLWVDSHFHGPSLWEEELTVHRGQVGAQQVFLHPSIAHFKEHQLLLHTHLPVLTAIPLLNLCLRGLYRERGASLIKLKEKLGRSAGEQEVRRRPKSTHHSRPDCSCLHNWRERKKLSVIYATATFGLFS